MKKQNTINDFFNQKSLSYPQLCFNSEKHNEFEHDIDKILYGKDLALSSLDDLSDELENNQTKEDIYDSIYNSNIIIISNRSDATYYDKEMAKILLGQ